MRIGIDISQLAYPNTGVANYLKSLVEHIVASDPNNEYVLFYSSLRRNFPSSIFHFSREAGSRSAGQFPSNVTVKQFKFPPKLLDLMWNKLHVISIERFIGDVDVFITSDWTEPPTKKAKKATIIYDMVVCKFPNETAEIIQNVQKRKNKWVKKESDVIFTISESAKQDIIDILDVAENKVKVIYPAYK